MSHRCVDCDTVMTSIGHVEGVVSLECPGCGRYEKVRQDSRNVITADRGCFL